jgi:nucleoid-associated protein YgaU
MFAREGISMDKQRTSSAKRRSILHGEFCERLKRGVFSLNFENAAFVISAIILVMAGLTLTSPQGSGQAWRSEPEGTILVTVQPGDTIWGIARRTSGENADLRRVVHEIAELNGLQSGVIRPGQGILVPSQPQQMAGTTKECFQ